MIGPSSFASTIELAMLSMCLRFGVTPDAQNSIYNIELEWLKAIHKSKVIDGFQLNKDSVFINSKQHGDFIISFAKIASLYKEVTDLHKGKK